MDQILNAAFEECRAQGTEIPPLGPFNYPAVDQVEMDKNIRIGQNLVHSEMLASWERVQLEATMTEKTNPAC